MKKIKIALLAVFVLLLCLPSALASVTSVDFFEMIGRNDADGIRQAILDGFDINGLYGEKHNLKTPLKYAVQKIRPEIVKILLESGADTEISDSSGMSPLFPAVSLATVPQIKDDSPMRMSDAAKILDLLLAHGTDANRVNIYGDTPLQYALMGGDYERSFAAAKKLLDAGAEINPILPPDKMTPLMWAVVTAAAEWEMGSRENRAELVKFLIESGADVNVSADGYTALHAAAAVDYGLTKMLLDAGANKKAKGGKGETPFTVAFKYRNFKVMALLLTY